MQRESFRWRCSTRDNILKEIENGALALPKHDDTMGNMNFVFIADEAFALTENILKPFPHKDLTQENKFSITDYPVRDNV